MARALCTKDNLPGSFEILYGGKFNTKKYGVLKLSHFSCFSILLRKIIPWRREYWYKVFYMAMGRSIKIHFTITWNDEAHKTAVLQYYTSRKNELHLLENVPHNERLIRITEDKITLIPEDELNVTSNLTSTSPLRIEKQIIDSHCWESMTAPPHCEMVAMPNVDQSVEQLFHKVKILGTNDEASYFTLICPYPKDSGKPRNQAFSTANSDPKERILGKQITQAKLNLMRWRKCNEDKSCCLKEEMSVKWREIGQDVGICDAILEGFWESSCHDNQKCMNSVITEWIRKSPEEYASTWTGLMKLLRRVSLNNLSNSIEEAADDEESTLYTSS